MRLSLTKRFLTNLAILTVSAVWLIPLIWTVSTAFRPERDLLNPIWWFPTRPTLENFKAAWEMAPFGLYYINTTILVLGILAVQMFTITFAGYAFARLKFPGRDSIFGLFLLQMMVPGSALLLPNYITMKNLHLIDHRLAMMLPYFASAIGTLLMRQAFKQVPIELDDAAKIDGCRWHQLLWYVYLPAAKPTLVAFSIVSISAHWNEFLWPLIVTNSQNIRPLTVGLALFTQMSETGAQWPAITAATLLVVFPLILLFLLFQRQFVSSFLRSGIK